MLRFSDPTSRQASLEEQQDAAVRNALQGAKADEKLALKTEKMRKLAPAGWGSAKAIAGTTLSDLRQTKSAKARADQEELRSELKEKKRQFDDAVDSGLPKRQITPGGDILVLNGVEDGVPAYGSTLNAEVRISNGVLDVQDGAVNYQGHASPVGLWDGGLVRKTHQEFNDHYGGGSRITEMESAPLETHATSMAGTIAGDGRSLSGGVTGRKGIAPVAGILSFVHDNDRFEIEQQVSNPLSGPEIYLSNHSYIPWYRGWGYYPYVVSPGNSVLLPGWGGITSFSTQEDSFFGSYDPTYSRTFDRIVYLYQTYLPVIAAGNEKQYTTFPSTGHGTRPPDHPSYPGQHVERASPGSPFGLVNSSLPAHQHPLDGAANGGFDTLQPYATTKNSLVVTSIVPISGGPASLLGANPPTVQLWSGASIGPPDDGRVKPDLAAAGVDVNSASSTSDTAYASGSGTSPAAAGVTGIVQLLRDGLGQFRGDEWIEAWLASTKRGLMIHTAIDVGNPGPDYTFGWGVPYPKAASDLIETEYDSTFEDFTTWWGSAPHLKEFKFISQAGTNTRLSYDVNASGGGEPLKITLAWTDPEGPAFVPALDKHDDIALVNDLDLRVYPPGSSIPLYPWKLDPANPSANAIKADNTVDNVEQIEILNPVTSGAYTVVVSHKGSLLTDASGAPAPQTASLILSGNVAVPEPELSLEIERGSGGTAILTFPAVVGGVYRVEGSPALDDTAWYPITPEGVTSIGTSQSILTQADTFSATQSLHSVVVSPPDDGTGKPTSPFFFRVERLQ